MSACFRHHLTTNGVESPLSTTMAAAPLLLDNGVPHASLQLVDYFQSCENFLAGRLADLGVDPSQSATITIASVKMGAFYHVARIDIRQGSHTRHFALNTAISHRNRHTLAHEAELLTRLAAKHNLLPTVYGWGEECLQKNGREYPFAHLLVHWFEQFHEWHLSRNDAFVLWAGAAGDTILPPEQAWLMLEEISRITTELYDFSSRCRLAGWHQGAGDFIVRPDNPCAVRLITIRAYRPLPFCTGAMDPMAALFYFLLDLSCRLRLDKRDGIGEPVWLPMPLTRTLLSGFFSALEQQEDQGRMPNGTGRAMRRLLAHFSRTELHTAMTPLLEYYDATMADGDLRLVRDNLTDHLNELIAGLATHSFHQ